jgi:hypothetical protein
MTPIEKLIVASLILQGVDWTAVGKTRVEAADPTAIAAFDPHTKASVIQLAGVSDEAIAAAAELASLKLKL